jgi:hypothetical protein
MELLQKRGFSEFFSDTFKFIKINGKHFFTNYFIINGIFLLLSFLKNYFTGTGYTYPFLFEMLYFAFILFFGVINASFVAVYMILYTTRGTDFSYRDILNYMKDNAVKIITFILVTLLLSIPVGIGFVITYFILAITIVGILLIPILIAALVVWFTLAFYEYLYTDRPVFDCFGYAFKLFTKSFWATTGSAALLYIVLVLVYLMALGATGVFSSFFKMNLKDPQSILDIQKTFFSPIVLAVMTLFSVLMVLLQVNQGIIYFSQKELLENINANKNIDSIGQIGQE